MDPQADFAARFGARIDLRPPASGARQLFFVKGAANSEQLCGAVRAAGGRPVIVGNGWLVAELDFQVALGLRRAPGIRLVSGVSLDAERLRQITGGA